MHSPQHLRKIEGAWLVIWSFIKIAIFFCLALAVASGVNYILARDGNININFDGKSYDFSPLIAILGIVGLFLATWLLFALAGLLLAVFRMLMGDETALSRYFDRNKERKGFDALTDSMIALAAGDGRKATNKATRAERLLG